MSDTPEEFKGGETPCQEGAADTDSQAADTPPQDPITSQDHDAPPDGGNVFGGAGVTAEEINEMMGNIPPELLAPDLPMVLASMAAMLEEQAWRHLGLVANPVTRQVEQDLQKAKIAIDVVAYITGQVSPLVGDAQRRDLQNKVSTLQVNFVEQSRQG